MDLPQLLSTVFALNGGQGQPQPQAAAPMSPADRANWYAMRTALQNAASQLASAQPGPARDAAQQQFLQNKQRFDALPVPQAEIPQQGSSLPSWQQLKSAYGQALGEAIAPGFGKVNDALDRINGR